MPVSRGSRNGGGGSSTTTIVEEAINVPRAFRRMYVSGTQPYTATSFDLNPGLADQTTIRIPFDDDQLDLADDLHDDLVAIELSRVGHPNARLVVDQTTKRTYISSIGGELGTDDGVELKILEVQVPTASIPDWVRIQDSETDFYIWGASSSVAVDGLELARVAKLAALGNTEIFYRKNVRTTNLGSGKDGNSKANMFVNANHKQWVFQPNDTAFEALMLAYSEGRLDAFHFSADMTGERSDIDFSAPDIGQTLTIDTIDFASPSARESNGNRIEVLFKQDVSAEFRQAPGTFNFAVQFNLLDANGVGEDFSLARTDVISTRLATAAHRAINLPLSGSIIGVKISMNPDELAAFRAAGYVEGDDVELVGLNADGVHIDGAYIKRGDFSAITFDDINGSIEMHSASGFPAAFSDPAMVRVYWRVYSGSVKLKDTELFGLMLRETSTRFVKKITTGDLIVGANTIKRTNTSIRWGANANERSSFIGLGLERGDRVVITAYNSQGVQLGDKVSKQWDSWTHFVATAGYIEISQSSGEPLAAIWLRQAAYLHIKLIPGFRARRDARLSSKASGLHYYRLVVSSLPSTTNQGMYFAPNTRTIYVYLTDDKKLQLRAHKLSANDGLQILTEGESGRELGTAIRTLFRPPTFQSNVVVFQFQDHEDLLPSSLTNAFQASLVIVPVEVAKKPWVKLQTWATGTTPGVDGYRYLVSEGNATILFDPDRFTEFVWTTEQVDLIENESAAFNLKPSGFLVRRIEVSGAFIQIDVNSDFGFTIGTSATRTIAIWGR